MEGGGGEGEVRNGEGLEQQKVILIADCSSSYKLLLQVNPEQWVNWVQAGDGSRQGDSQVAGCGGRPTSGR